ncbi:Na+:H+ antiporter, NhaA family [Shinella sp. WSC3-e]|nr:hypothetical protein SHINE37_42917 [Rhizobiaceae bacterium]CAK7257481.1 Na+:H+ antiporter, NhaA family [Shinella sp. WSC3-e]
MKRTTPAQKRPRAQILTERALASLERFLHIEAVSGAVLLVAAAVALIWANSPLSESYHHLWHMSLSVGVGELVFDRPLHFWINDALMTVFFLVVGMEIRREIHEGALSDLRQASLPIGSHRRCSRAGVGLSGPERFRPAGARLGHSDGHGHRLRRRRSGAARQIHTGQCACVPADAGDHRRRHCRPHHCLLLFRRFGIWRLCRSRPRHRHGVRSPGNGRWVGLCLCVAGSDHLVRPADDRRTSDAGRGRTGVDDAGYVRAPA